VRLANAEDALRAIRTGEVDTVVVAGPQGSQIFTLQGADHAYRMLIERMNEGALMLASDKMILYANQRFAKMVKCPLEQVTGSSFSRFLCAEDRAALRLLLKLANPSGTTIQVMLQAADGARTPAHISIRPLARNGSQSAAFGLVVTDMTEARRTEELLRALTQRVVQAQEAERGRVALELHDNITQLLCATLIRSQALADKLPARDGPAKAEALKLREMLGRAAEAVERISRDLRPSVLEHLGLVEVLRNTGVEFTKQTGVSLKMTCVALTERLPANIELTLYRILQEALKNVEKHAHARRVTVHLTKPGEIVQLVIRDDGFGFDPDHHSSRGNRKDRLGLLGMRERATFVDGTLSVNSARGKGTTIDAQIPLGPVNTNRSRGAPRLSA
jgi:PAS domain S-box-containing protein